MIKVPTSSLGRTFWSADRLLTLNCGGDCWGCMGEVEDDGGWEPSLKKVRKEHALGLRPGWIDPQLILPLFSILLKPRIMRTSCLAAGPLSSVAQTSSG